MGRNPTNNSWQTILMEGHMVKPFSLRLGYHGHVPPWIVDNSKRQRQRVSEGRAQTTAFHGHDLPLITTILLFMFTRNVQAESLLTLDKEQEELSPGNVSLFHGCFRPNLIWSEVASKKHKLECGFVCQTSQQTHQDQWLPYHDQHCSKTQARVRFIKIGNINFLVTATKVNSAPCVG